MGCAVRELVRDARGAVGVAAQLHCDEPIAFRAPIVVACDGRFSALRRAAGIGLRERAVPFDLLWFSTPIPAGLANRAYLRTRRNELFAAFASRSDRMQIGWLIHKGEYAHFRTQAFGDVQEHIATHVPIELDDAASAIEHERRPAVAATQRTQNLLTSALYALGPGIALRLAVTAVRFGARVSFRPRFVTRAVNRFRGGDQEVRADRGPWQRS
jgi:2-polyprenyl-6-methoxyphenol hydroxylase-like FAD-dependent oxidoreductase